MNCEVCGEDVDTHPTIDVRNRSQLLVCQDRVVVPCGDRHPKWKKVEPGTVIPAGQPYRVEDPRESSLLGNVSRVGVEYINRCRRAVPEAPIEDWFVDSSWKPPLVLPETPTWGIVVHRKHGISVRCWYLEGDELMNTNGGSFREHSVLDFIPLTDEQVARIEAVR